MALRRDSAGRQGDAAALRGAAARAASLFLPEPMRNRLGARDVERTRFRAATGDDAVDGVRLRVDERGARVDRLGRAALRVIVVGEALRLRVARGRLNRLIAAFAAAESERRLAFGEGRRRDRR